MKDNIELVDRDYSRVRPTDRIIGKLRLKRTSFSRVLGFFNNFRISRLEKKLDKANKELEEITKNAEVIDESVEKEILKKTMAIVKLEEKLNILKLENVPSSYIENRAIKLKNEMMEAARKNARSAYAEESVEEKTVNDEASDYGFTDFANTDFAMAAMPKKESEEEKDDSKSFFAETDNCSIPIQNDIYEMLELCLKVSDLSDGIHEPGKTGWHRCSFRWPKEILRGSWLWQIRSAGSRCPGPGKSNPHTTRQFPCPQCGSVPLRSRRRIPRYG